MTLHLDDVLTAARGLLGRRLRSTVGGVCCEVVLTEVEAYDGPNDPASHAFRGPTPRNQVMFGPPGRLYVYRSYGIHWCMNVVTGPRGRAEAVLLRGGIAVAGRPEMELRRGRAKHLTDGPGKLTQALGITGEHNGIDLLAGGEITLLDEKPVPGLIRATPRIGISRATEREWRFLLEVDD